MKSVVSSSLSFTGALLTAAAIVTAGCSSSTDDPGESLPGSDDPQTEPDPNGTTTIARLGYPDARDLSDDLVSMSYLRQYYELDQAISSLLQGGDKISDVTIDCPDGGTVSGELSIFSFEAREDIPPVLGE